MVSIGVVGDFDPTNDTHLATTASLRHAGEAAGLQVEVAWVPTTEVHPDPEGLRAFDGLLIAPGSPYASIDGALTAIRLARTRFVPLLATCAGFQHVIVEFARNILGVTDAHHAEYDPSASTLFITPLICSLAGRQMAITLCPDTVAAASYGSPSATERYYCNFGLNPDHRQTLVTGGLVVSAVDDDDEVRIMEIPGHPFFVGTLFVPQTSSHQGNPHPLVSAFVAAAR